MLRSLFSGISGLRAHQQMMDVTGNNIANVNTAGYKASSTVFEDTLSQMMKAAGAPQNGNGGTNPAQIGLGVRMGGINTNFTQGAAQATGRSTDLMINGDGFFMLKSGGEDLYSRSGAFNFDTDGKLVASNGATVQGWLADPTTGLVNPTGPTTAMQLPLNTMMAPQPTLEVTLSGNLPGETPAAGSPIVTVSTPVTAYDQLGNKMSLTVTFTQTDPTTPTVWDVSVSDGVNPDVGPTTVTFDGTGANPDVTSIDFNGVNVDLTSVTSYAGTSSAVATANGAPAASLSSFTISPVGEMIGVFSNGLKQTLGQLAMANFTNPPGLEKAGDSQFRATVNSGTAQVGVANSGGRGTLQGGSLEMSNVDLAQEFTNLIIAQRGFQANSKVISTSDQLLEELVNLKR
jgi:flagellar hook protein FlgE